MIKEYNQAGEKMIILVEELREVLAEELHIYEDMLELTKKKTEIITNGQINDLDNITQIENSLILKLGQFENRREKIVNNIQKQFQIEDELSITDILDCIEDKEDGIKQEMNGMIEKLSSVLKEIKEKNDLNSLLIKDTLEYIELNINLLTSVSEQGTYNNRIKKEQTSQKISLFDTKA